MIMEVQYIDYGVGNKKSVINALLKLKHEISLVDNPDLINPKKPIILPGVGSYLHCKKELEKLGFFKVIKDMLDSKAIEKLIGICVGHQLLFERGYEDGNTEGFGVFEGEVRSMKELASDKKFEAIVPNISWCEVKDSDSKNIGKYYFIHSFANLDSKNQVAYYLWNNFKITALARIEGVWGTQFHPEKSGEKGLRLFNKMITLKSDQIL